MLWADLGPLDKKPYRNHGERFYINVLLFEKISLMFLKVFSISRVLTVAFMNLCIQKKFHSGILKLFEGNFHQGIKLQIIYFSLTDINIKTVIILFSIHVPSINTPKSSADKPLSYL